MLHVWSQFGHNTDKDIMLLDFKISSNFTSIDKSGFIRPRMSHIRVGLLAIHQSFYSFNVFCLKGTDPSTNRKLTC